MLWLNVLFFTGLVVGSLAEYMGAQPTPQEESLFYSVPKACKNGAFMKKCCKGYFESPYNASLCIPVCEERCSEHSVCAAPNVCKCKSIAYRVNNTCLPLCPRGHTSCLAGYCLGGDCVCPVAGHTGTYQCPATCQTPCPLTQVCIDKDTCGCQNGFTLESGICKPYCERACLNGECVAPNTCVCNPGAKLLDGVCQADCWQDCKNGKCIRPNVCQCNMGFALQLPELICGPRCPGCELGVCLENGKCLCPAGLKYLHKKCQINCTSCGKHGICREDEACDCEQGYYYSYYHYKCCRRTVRGSEFTCLE